MVKFFIFQNIAPQHVQDIVVFIDAITVVFEEASKGGSPLSLPIASIEVGHGHSLPNLALRYMLIFRMDSSKLEINDFFNKSVPLWICQIHQLHLVPNLADSMC